MSVAASEPVDPAPRPRGGSLRDASAPGLRDLGRRRRTLITVVGSLATAALDRGAADVALLTRSEPCHLTIRVAGATVNRRVLYRTSSPGSWAAWSTRKWRSPLAVDAAAVLILGSDGVAAAVAAGVLLTATGTAGDRASPRGPAPTSSGPSVAEAWWGGVLWLESRGRTGKHDSMPD